MALYACLFVGIHSEDVCAGMRCQIFVGTMCRHEKLSDIQHKFWFKGVQRKRGHRWAVEIDIHILDLQEHFINLIIYISSQVATRCSEAAASRNSAFATSNSSNRT